MKIGDLVRVKNDLYPTGPYSIPGWVVGVSTGWNPGGTLFEFVNIHFPCGIRRSFNIEYLELVASIDVDPTYNGDAS